MTVPSVSGQGRLSRDGIFQVRCFAGPMGLALAFVTCRHLQDGGGGATPSGCPLNAVASVKVSGWMLSRDLAPSKGHSGDDALLLKRDPCEDTRDVLLEAVKACTKPLSMRPREETLGQTQRQSLRSTHAWVSMVESLN